ncbi:MAG: hypothetical protein KDI92_08890 [Xanthomonadales bacterium]|nr:hypothetical protein [Xanthomonadales bacterium]
MKQKELVSAVSRWIGVSVFSIHAVQAGDVFTVNSIGDQPTAGLITLREAIELANSTSGSIIDFDETLFSEPQTITLEQGDLALTSSTTINGPGADLLTIDAQGLSRVLTIDDANSTSQNVNISKITFTGGNGEAENPGDFEYDRGGCVFNKETLTLSHVVITGCEANVDGGGFFSLNAQVTISDSEISHNSTTFRGGGIKSDGGQLTITNSTLSDNTANRNVFAGGAIEINNTPLLLINSTVSNNHSAPGATGGISVYFNSTLTLINTTVVNNAGGGVLVSSNSLVNMSNSIIAGHSDGDCEFSNISAQSDNQNNLDTDGSCDVLATNHITVTDPMLGPLTDNGGSTSTHLPLPDSPVIDRGDDVLCSEVDQLGRIRPQDGDGDDIPVCDIGAIEFSFFLDELIFTNGFD